MWRRERSPSKAGRSVRWSRREVYDKSFELFWTRMRRMERLAGKVAFITGGAGSIGLATARLFLSEGARVAISDRSRPPRLDGDALFVHADVTDSAAVRAAVGACVSAFGGLDVAFANAGVFGALA